MWYIVQVAAGSEAHMKETLERFLQKSRGASQVKEVFFPLYESSYKKGGVRRTVTRVLFPGYLFLDVEQDDIRQRLKGITEFHHLLMTGEACIPVRREEQTFLVEHTDSGHVMRMSRGYMVGREVIITEGALASYRGELKYVDRHNQYGVMAVRLGEREVDMRFGLEIVRKVEST